MARKKVKKQVSEEHEEMELDSQTEDGFFRLCFGTKDSEPYDIPRDIFHHIIQFISPYPYYFTLRSVSKQWLYEFETVIYDSITNMDGVNRISVSQYENSSMFRYYSHRYANRKSVHVIKEDIKYKPLYASGTAKNTKYYDRSPVYEFLGERFPNRLDYCANHIGQLELALRNMLPFYTQLERIELIGSPYTMPSNDAGSILLIIGQYAPSTLKSLSLINFPISTNNIAHLKQLLGTEERIHETPFVLEKISLPYMRVLYSPDIEKSDDFIALKTKLGENFTYSILLEGNYARSYRSPTELNQKLLVEFINYMRYHEGFAANNILCYEHNSAMSCALSNGSELLFNYMWDQLINQIKKEEEVSISPPSTTDIAQAMLNNSDFAFSVLKKLTSSDAPEGIPFDINDPIKNAYSNALSRYYTTTLLGKAIESSTVIFDYLMEKKVDVVVPNAMNPLMLAIVYNRSSEVMKSMVDRDPRVLTYGMDDKGSGTAKVVPYWAKRTEVEQVDKSIELQYKFRPLHAILLLNDGNNRLEQFKTIHQLGSPMDAVDSDGNTCLHLCCLSQKHEILEYILQHISKEDILVQNYNGMNCIEQVFQNTNYGGHIFHDQFKIKTLRLLVDKYGEGESLIKNMRVGPYENNCLHLLTSRLYSSEVAKLVTYLNKDCGIDINEQNLLGQVPIQLLPSMFAHSQVNSLLTQLLGLKADVYHKSKNGQSYFGYILQTDINTAEKIIENSGVDIRAMKFDQNQNIFHLLFTHHAASLIEHKSARRYRSNDSTARRSLFLKLLNDESTWDLLQQPDDQGISPLMVLYSSAPLNCKKFIDEYDNFVEYFIDEPMSTDDAAVPLQYLTRIQKFDTPFYTYYLSNTKTHLMEKDEKAPGKPTILHQLIQHSTIKTITKFFKVLQDNAEQEEIVEFVNEKLEAKEDDMQQDGKTALVLAAEEGDITLMGNLIAHGAKVEACAPYNLVQIFVDKKWYYSALAIMCEGDYAKVDFSAELFTSVLAKLMAVDTELRDEVIIDGLEMLLKRVEKQKLLELLLCIPDVQNSTEMEYAFADHCSILQLVCFGKRKTLFDWIFDTFDLTDQALLAAVDSKYDNNILHFVCTSKLSFLAPKPILEEGQVDELRKQERPREGKRNDQAHAKQMMLKLYEFDAVKNKDLLNQPNKRQDTPVHISCMCSMQMLWAEMVNLGANMDLKNVDDKFPRELLINDSTIKAYNRVVKGGQSAAVAKKEAKPKAATKRATRSTNKRKRTAQEEEDEESAQEEEEEEPPKKNRRTTRSRK